MIRYLSSLKRGIGGFLIICNFSILGDRPLDIYENFDVICRRSLPGYQCPSLETGTRKDRCQTTLWISQKSGKIESKTRRMCLERVLEMKKSSLPQIPPPTQAKKLTLMMTTTTIRASILQLQGGAFSATSTVALKPDT